MTSYFVQIEASGVLALPFRTEKSRAFSDAAERGIACEQVPTCAARIPCGVDQQPPNVSRQQSSRPSRATVFTRGIGAIRGRLGAP